MRLGRFLLAFAVVGTVAAAVWVAPQSSVKREPVPVPVASNQAVAIPAPQPVTPPVTQQSPATPSVAVTSALKSPAVNPSTGKTASPAPAASKPVVIKPTIARSEDRRMMMRAAMAARLSAGADSALPVPAPRDLEAQNEQPEVNWRPTELVMQAAGSFDGDLRDLPQTPVRRREKPEREGPEPNPIALPSNLIEPPPAVPTVSAPAPAPSVNFDGVDFATLGQGHPPDTNGDVGPNHFVESVNTGVAIYSKAGGAPLATFSFDTFMSQAPFGNLCDTDNFGDPVVLYDTFEDRWIITDFAFQLSGGDIVNPPGMFECFAVSKTGDPVAGGWNFYSINTTGGLGDYPKFGIWPDGLYVSFNMFDYEGSGGFQNVRLYAFNKAQMYAGAPAAQAVSFDLPSTEFSLMPSNARLQTGTPPAGRPNYFTSVWNFSNAISTWRFHVDWAHVALSTLTGPTHSLTASSWTTFTGTANNFSVPVPAGGVHLDPVQIRLMMQNQYSNIGGIESLWNSHTVGIVGAATKAAVRFYQHKVTGDVIEANATQAVTYSPDAGVLHRFMPSVAVNKNGDMAIGYNTSSTAQNPALVYAGRLATDPVNTISLTETTLVAGGGTQTGTNRWGDYATMTLDPDGCKFWTIGEYYQVNGINWKTRIGAFTFDGCTPDTTGSLSGTVRNSANTPIPNAVVKLGVRTATTNATGVYTFAGLPDGTYPSVTAAVQGYNSQTFTNIVVPGGGSVVQNFTLTSPVTSGCFTDTTQLDFQADVAAINCDLNTSPGNVMLSQPTFIDQQNTTVTLNGFGFSSTSWAGQTFTATASGPLTRADLQLFCSGCTGTFPNLTVAIRATAFDMPTNSFIPTGPDLATATVAGFNTNIVNYYAANFASPVNIVAGTRYAVIVRAVSNPSAGVYAYTCSCSPDTNPYANGQRVTSGTSGATWAADLTVGGRDLGFRIWVNGGYAATGTFTSSIKDANPVAGGAATWGNISWNANVPGGTTLQFRVAGSNSINGPFNFVGPDGTANTSFSNSASLAQFNGMRYVRYQATMTSTGAATPTINDVTICFTTSPKPVLDLNADGTGDVFTYSSSTGVWKRQVTQPDGTFIETGASSNLFNWLPGWSVVPAKFNQDNHTDFFLFNPTNGNWFKMLNDGVSGFTEQANSQWWNGWQRFVMELNGDGISDLFLYDPATGVWFKSFSTPTGFTYEQGAWNPNWEITPMTLNGDSLGDMFLINRSTGRWFWVLGNAGAGFTYPVSEFWFPSWNLYPGDFNADGLTDLLLHDPPTGMWFVSMNNGLGNGFTYTSGHWVLGWTPYVGDLDADGDADVFVHNSSSGAWTELISNGLGQFTSAGSGAWVLGWNIYVSDFNADKRADLLLYNPSNGVWYMARNLTPGTFTYTTGSWAANLTIIVRTPFM